MGRITSWSIPGADGQTILGNMHEPESATAASPRGVVLLAHGFLGYKDYGMFPFLAQCFADGGYIAHRFNFSHSGMTNRIETFERLDLFAKDTWSKQVFDLNTVIDAIDRGELAGCGLPYALYGHSRGGVTVLLTSGGRFRADRRPLPAGVITAAAPSFTARLPDEQRDELLERGYAEVVSSRTGQTLHVGRAWLAEQLDRPEEHDLSAHVASIRCPLLIAHGTRDPTVPPACAEELANAVDKAHTTVRTLLVSMGDHVFNVQNPFPLDGEPSPQLREFSDTALAFLHEVCPR